MRLRVSSGWAVTVLLAAVGCGQTSGANDPGSGAGSGGGVDAPSAMGLDFAQSGSRVVALGYSSNEARLFRTFHDQQLGFDCDFVPDAAGRDQRCVPSATVTLVYTDAGCTEPAAWDERGRSNPLPVGEAVSESVYGAWGCPGDAPPHREAYRVGERLSEEVVGGSVDGLFQIYGGRCQPASPPAKSVPAVVRLSRIPESTLARGARVSVNVGSGLRLTRLLADDGAELTLGVTGADGTPCELQGNGECVPEPIARPAGLFVDKFYMALNADCSIPAFQMPYPAECGVPKFGVADDDGQSRRVVAMEKTDVIFGLDFAEPTPESSGINCTPKQVGQAGWFAAPGAEVTGTLPVASRRRRGAGQLYVDWFTVGERELLPVLTGFQQASWGVPPAGQFEDVSGGVCHVLPAEDGSLRCVLLDASGRTPVDLTTFAEVVPFTY